MAHVYNFAQSTLGFYIKGINTNIPKDAIPISNDEYYKFFKYQNDVEIPHDYSFNIKTATFNYTPKVIDYIPMLKSKAKECLQETDYLIVSDTFAELSIKEQKQLIEYRKYLRTVMNGTEDFININKNTKLKLLEDF